MRRLLALALLIIAAACATRATPSFQPQVAFLNHCYVVLDQETADAIVHSDYLRQFGVFDVRSTVADGGEHWTGRYLTGRETYLEMFGPHDLQGPGSDPGSAGLGISPDRAGDLHVLTARLAQLGVDNPDIGERTREMDGAQIPWFDSVSPRGDGDTFSIWAMEYLQSFFDSLRSNRKPPSFSGDVSRRRYLPDSYAQHAMRDVVGVEIGTTSHDIAMARPFLIAAGFAVAETPQRLVARDHDTTITLDAVARDAAGLRRIDFALNAAAPLHVEQLGRSTLTVGPGRHAHWVFQSQH